MFFILLLFSLFIKIPFSPHFFYEQRKKKKKKEVPIRNKHRTYLSPPAQRLTYFNVCDISATSTFSDVNAYLLSLTRHHRPSQRVHIADQVDGRIQ